MERVPPCRPPRWEAEEPLSGLPAGFPRRRGRVDKPFRTGLSWEAVQCSLFLVRYVFLFRLNYCYNDSTRLSLPRT